MQTDGDFLLVSLLLTLAAAAEFAQKHVIRAAQ
jgi:hypothetical protein